MRQVIIEDMFSSKKAKTILPFYLFTLLLFLSSCSMTKNIPEGDQLFVGLKPIEYVGEKDDQYETHLENTKLEVEAALATEPNGSLFGSSYYTVPWSWHLWVYDHYSGKDSKFAKWMVKNFGRQPVLMSNVNPALRASVAQSVLRNNGYFRSSVDYETIPTKNPKKSRIRYTVNLDTLFTLDSVSYINYPKAMKQLIDSTHEESLIKRDMPFSAANLENERTRISNLFRNNGYYYYVPGYATYLADTFAVESKSQLRFQLINELPQEVLKKWYIGNIDIQFRKSFREQLTDSLKRRHLTFHYNGKRLPVIPGVILRNLRLKPRQEYSYDNHLESASKINATGVFSSTDFQFTPRPNTDTLDLSINCVFDKPYDFYIEGNAIGRTNGRVGPEVKIGFTKRNLFRGAEKLDLNLHGSYQWQTSSDDTGGSYQYGADVSLEFPRIIAPFYNSDRIRRNKNGTIRRRRRFYAAPTTLAKISTDIIQRPEYYKMHVVSGEWTYRWQPTETSRHEFSPLTLKYQFKNNTTEKYQELVDNNMFLERTMQDYFVPKMRYTYTYTSPSSKLNPIRWETTIEESGNFVSLLDMIRGKSFNEKDKTLFKTPYSQFLRFETDFTKTWTLGNQTKLVGHINTGIIWSYGNSDVPPFSEQFYAGGANSIRAFRVRDVGPGRFNYFASSDRQFNYLFRNGEMKLIMNLEYRTPLWGNLHGAVFLDAGNVWDLWGEPQLTDDIISQYPEEDRPYARVLQMWEDQSMFKPSEFFNDIALGTGIGLRYDLGFLVIRLDWGIALHFPYTTYKDEYTPKGGYFNIAHFKDAHTLNFAVGYPF